MEQILCDNFASLPLPAKAQGSFAGGQHQLDALPVEGDFAGWWTNGIVRGTFAPNAFVLTVFNLGPAGR